MAAKQMSPERLALNLELDRRQQAVLAKGHKEIMAMTDAQLRRNSKAMQARDIAEHRAIWAWYHSETDKLDAAGK